jgi:hypothetical protein
MMFFVSTCKVALPTQEEQRTNLNTATSEIQTTTSDKEDSTYTQTIKNKQHVSVRDDRFDVRVLPGPTPFWA